MAQMHDARTMPVREYDRRDSRVYESAWQKREYLPWEEKKKSREILLFDRDC